MSNRGDERVNVTPSDNPLVKYLLIFAAIGVAGILGGDLVSEDAGTITQVIDFLTPIGAVVVVLVKGGEVAQSIIRKSDQNAEGIAQVKEAVNGRLDDRFLVLRGELRGEIDGLRGDMQRQISELRSLIEQRLSSPPE